MLVLDQCEISDNVANSGAAIEIARQGSRGGTDAVPTIVVVNNTVIARNRVIDLGAAFNLASCQQVVFQNTTFVNNSGAVEHCLASDHVRLRCRDPSWQHPTPLQGHPHHADPLHGLTVHAVSSAATHGKQVISNTAERLAMYRPEWRGWLLPRGRNCIPWPEHLLFQI